MDTINSNRLSFRFATINDKKDIFDMLVSEEISQFMFNEKFPAPTWEEFNDEGDHFFSGNPCKDGSYLLIELNNEVIGTISYTCEYIKKTYCELDIWFKGSEYLGKGYGPEAIKRIILYVHEMYNINTFFMRPWVKNINAIKAYKKCGFIEDKDFKVEEYYSDDMVNEYGEGDYKEETVNLVKII